VEGDPSVSSRTPQASVQTAQNTAQGDNATEEEQSRIAEKRRVIMAVMRILDSGTLDEKSFRLLEQLADCVQCPPAKMAQETEPDEQAERVVAAKEAGERETNASGQLTVPEAAGRRETKELCPMGTAESTGAQETNVPEERSAAMRRDGEPLTNAAMERRQKEAAADRHQAAAGEPSSVREGIGPVPLSATDPGRKMRGAAGSDRPQLAAARTDPVETSCNEPSVTHKGGDLIERMERQRPTAARSVEGSPDIDVERHSCSTTDQQARLAAMK
jgi:hypothetical protein